jgi:putrescine transport system ATP-binding protein
MAALDKKLRQETQFELMELRTRLGLTFVIVTHDQEEAMTVADRIAVMDRGRIVQVARPAEVYERPNSRWVAEFIGDVNLFEGRIAQAGGDGVAIASAAGPLRAAPAGAAKQGDVVWVALRPEKVRIGRGAPDGAENSVAGRVIDVGYLGDMSVYKVALDSGATMKAKVANVARSAIAAGDRVWLSWPADAAVVLEH